MDALEQYTDVDGFGNEIVDADVFHVWFASVEDVGGDDQDRCHGNTVGAQQSGRFPAIDIRHVDVQDDQVRLMCCGLTQGGNA